MSAGNGERDVVHISPGLVKILAGSILTGLIVIAGYMAAWGLNDASFKTSVTLRLDGLSKQLDEVKTRTDVVPTNTQKIIDHERRISNVEQRERAIDR